MTPTHQSLHLEWCRARQDWTLMEWNLFLFSDKSRLNLTSDDNHVWRPCGEPLNPAFTLQQHTFPTVGVMVWGATAYDTRSPLILIHSTMTDQQYVHNILQQHLLPLMAGLPGACFQQDNAQPHRAQISQNCLR
ncbi:Transposable element Tcb2 transposase, partial [Stegodyphus mimosarum]